MREITSESARRGSTNPGKPTEEQGVLGLILDIDKFATHDGPGIRTAVYLKGCPLRCDWCHSPESQALFSELVYHLRKCSGCGACVAACPNGAITLTLADDSSLPSDSGSRRITIDRAKCERCFACASVCYRGALREAGLWRGVEEIIQEVEKDRAFFEASGGGLTVSGGEVASQPTFSLALLSAAHERGISTAIETSGQGRPETFAALVPVTDLFLYDLKYPDPVRHKTLTGVSLAPILRNLELIVGLGAKVIARIPLIPGINDTVEAVETQAVRAKGLGVREIHLLPYNAAASAKYAWIDRDFALGERESQNSEHLARLVQVCEAAGLRASVGG